MHIEPGVVDAAKIVLSYATAAGAAGYAGWISLRAIREQGAGSLLLRSGLSGDALAERFRAYAER